MTTQQPEELQHGSGALVIARNMRAQIESGMLEHNQQLPSTRQLANEWHTSVATVTRAMNQLADEGLVINRARSSRLVYNPPTPENEHVTVQSPIPVVIMIGGLAGSGKTELGRILARLTGWPILDKDTTTRPVVEAALERLGHSPHDRESETYLTTVRPAEYQALIATAAENVQCGNSAIVTAPFIQELSDPAWCDRIAANVESMSAALHVIWVHCDPETMHTYLRQRGAARDTAKMADWQGYLEAANLDMRPSMPHHVIDNSASSPPLQRQAKELLSAL